MSQSNLNTNHDVQGELHLAKSTYRIYKDEFFILMKHKQCITSGNINKTHKS